MSYAIDAIGCIVVALAAYASCFAFTWFLAEGEGPAALIGRIAACFHSETNEIFDQTEEEE